jgi:hypothetical protein
MAVIGGLTAYSYLALGMPGGVTMIHKMGTVGVVIVSIIGAAGGVAIVWIWKEIQDFIRHNSKSRAA